MLSARHYTEALCFFLGLFLQFFLISGSQAGIALDGTFGTKGSLTGPDYTITSGMGQQMGGNLFHSFSLFSINNSESATFTGPADIGNIIARVTGGQSSNIDGLLRSGVQGADLYFINPSGVIFGENASLDVSGSFHVSTADYIKMGDTGRFDASNPGNSTLTIAPPSAFGFIGSSPKDISLDGCLLQVPEGKTISLLGGGLSISNANLYAPSGTINMVSVASSGEAIFSDSNFNPGSFGKLGEIDIRDTRSGAEKPAYDFNPDNHIGNIDVSGTGGGKVFIRGGRFILDNGWVFADTWGDDKAEGMDIKIEEEITASNSSYITAETLGGGNAGLLLIEATKLTLDYSVISTKTSGSGNAGYISLDVTDLNMTDGSDINSDTKGAGQGGGVNINASNSVSLSDSYISTNAFDTGDSGYINIETPSLVMDDFALVIANTHGSGNAGGIDMNVGSLIMKNGSQVNSFSTSTGDGGMVTINATDSISISGYYTDDQGYLYNTGLYCTAEAEGKGGFINITTPSLKMDDFALIAANTIGSGDAGSIWLNVGTLSLKNGSQINSFSSGTGNGGTLNITATDSISVSGYYNDVSGDVYNSGFFCNANDLGDSGSIYVKAPSLIMDNKAEISTSAYEEGNAGYIKLTVDKLSLEGGARIESDTNGAGSGGEIDINASDSVTLSNNSYIATTGWSAGKAGFIIITTPSLDMDAGRISTDANGDGAPGNIVLNIDALALDNGSKINSDISGKGGGGGINIIASNSISISDSSITTEGKSGSKGAAGYISIEASSFTMDNGKISSTANGEGDAGYIMLDAGAASLTNFSGIESDTRGAGVGGYIDIEASNSVTVSDNSYISTEAYSTGLAGAVSIKASDLNVDKFSIISANAYSSGNAGEITVNVGTLSLKDGAQINSFSSGKGNGGSVLVKASDSITLSGSYKNDKGISYSAGFFCSASSEGNGGYISVKTPSLTMDDFALIAANTYGSGNAGNIELNVGTLSLENGSQINSFSDGAGHGGTLSVNATDSVTLSGYYKTDKGVDYSSGFFCTAKGEGNGGYISVKTPSLTMDKMALIAANTLGSGNAGDIELDVGNLSLKNGSQINSFSDGAGHGGTLLVNATGSVYISGFFKDDQGDIYSSGFFCSAYASGDGGRISMTTPSLVIDNGKISVRTFLEGLGGNIAINADDMQLSNGAVITSSSSGSGNAGDIILISDFLRIDDSLITTSAGKAAGGNINITARDIQLTNNSGLTASVASGEGGGGNVDINTVTLVALQDSDITARADQGFGGDITINSQVVLFSGDVDLNASSNVVGKEGRVEVKAPAIDISGNLADLPETFLNADALLPRPCAEREGGLGSFVVRGRDGLPPLPDSLLTSP